MIEHEYKGYLVKISQKPSGCYSAFAEKDDIQLLTAHDDYFSVKKVIHDIIDETEDLINGDT